MELRGKIAVVTGAGSGIGAAIARHLGREGADVVVADIDEASAQETATAVSSEHGVRTLALRCDVGDRSSVQQLADAAWAEFGRVDVLVNNAGVFPGAAPAVDIEEQNARWVLEINVLGVWHGCSIFGKRFIEQGSPAHILNTGSENSVGIPHVGAAIYTASKHAVLGLSDVLRRELPEFIGVSVLCPGMVATNTSKSGLRRPERFGAPFEAAPSGPPPGMDADEVGRRAVAGITKGDFYVFTHPPVVELAEERWAEISAAFADQAPRFDGDEELDTRAYIRRLNPS